MEFSIIIDSIEYWADLSSGKSIAITLLPNGSQPNHFGAPECSSQTLVAGDFIGDTKQGGSCNVNQLTIIPHCNGTHTESVSHIINELIPVYRSIEQTLFPCVLISIEAAPASENVDEYIPSIDSDNLVITLEILSKKLKCFSDVQLEGLVIRTRPNLSNKKSQIYDNDHYPVYLTNDAMKYLRQRKVKHLLVDLPSVDKMYDDGILSNHRIFWNVELGKTSRTDQTQTNKTITEMIYADETIEDGFYLCNLQIPEIETDAVPSRPELYQLNKK